MWDKILAKERGNARVIKGVERNLSWNSILIFRSKLVYVFGAGIIYILDDNVKVYVVIALKMKDCKCLSIDLKQPVSFTKNRG